MSKLTKYLGLTPLGIVYAIGMITFGCALYAIGINTFILPNKFGNGGVAGIAILIYYINGMKTGTTNLIINSVLLIIGYRFLEKRTLFFTIYAMFMMSWFMDVLHTPPFVSSNILIAAVAGGIMIGSGMGLIVRGFGTSAGLDIIAYMLKKYVGMNFAMSVTLMNYMVVLASSFVIGFEKTIVTLILKYVSGRMIENFTDGFNRRKAMMIITKEQDKIGEQIVHKIDRGITVLRAYGYYTRKDKDVLYVIVNRMQMIQIQRLVTEIDPKAFITITDVQSVIGQGFTFFTPTNRNNKLITPEEVETLR